MKLDTLFCKNTTIFRNQKSQLKKKIKYTVSRFLHTGPKKGVENEYEVYFAKIRDNKIRHTFLGSKYANFQYFD